MTDKILLPFEVLGSPLAPVPGAPALSQGIFIQVSNLSKKDETISLEYESTPAFQSSMGSVSLLCDVITGNGVPPTLAQIAATTSEFLTVPVGFKAQKIPAKATWIFGVQYFFPPAMPPMSSVEARGYVTLKGHAGAKFLILPTTRQVFYNYSGSTLLDISESAYAVPTVGGPEITL